jgi:DNA-directed RNA polymerase beta' subunit
MQYGDKIYENYPKVDTSLPREEIGKHFSEVVNLQNTYLSAMNGDYDGDQITVKGVFSQEANLEAEKIMYSKASFMSINGTPTRTTTLEAIQCCYGVTRWANPKEHF